MRTMQCDICQRTGGSRLPFLCPIDARNQLYEPRVLHARVLLEKDSLDREITALVSQQSKDTNKPNEITENTKESVNRWQAEQLLAERQRVQDRTQQIIAHADELRTNVEKAREALARKKASIARRKSELASASNGVEARRTKQIEDVDKSTKITRYKWNQVHVVTASSRAFLCGEAAKLYGLQRVKRSSGNYDYKIGGISIVDLRAMNTAAPAQISTSLSHVVHLLMLSTHYLSIRLPAEITLPHRDYPLPTIFPISQSYIHTNVPFPGSTPGHSSSTSPSASRHVDNTINLPRPRPLFISKPLPILASEDPASYALFLEGVTLLAYNIAWLCKSQGVSVGESSSFEDICAMGQNFYNLLIGSQIRPSLLNRVPSGQNVISPKVGTAAPGSQQNGDAVKIEEKKVPNPIMGLYSHGTAHHFLGSAEGTDIVRSWKLPNPMKLVDKLKSKLMSEAATAEWEVLDQEAWAVEDEMADDGVVVGARKERERDRGFGLGGMQSFMSMRTVMDAVELVSGDGGRKPGTSGWTKLKPR
ncbi:UV radiation resistance protein and autophagy-related subunit 14-domain-containing protein [Xylogone sp. PMI_703]|nr:UV radiation resistance protein and autophagy-related subunit 14-domain-containing protein [Xylogone sp. PMI_703]